LEAAGSFTVSASLSTHVLDTAAGGPRAGVAVTLRDESGAVVARGATDVDGRVAHLAADLAPGIYQLTWDSDGHFLAALSATIRLTEDRHYHVPLLASPVSGVVYLGT
jgi:5-hydroxyisourate hydrolase